MIRPLRSRKKNNREKKYSLRANAAGSRPYWLINIILAGIIGLIFVYSALFRAEKDRYPVPSFYEEITGEKGPSSGMSRAFSELVRGRIESAKAYNEDRPLIFAFFVIQFVQRIYVLLILRKSTLKPGTILVTDIALSLILFLYCFKGQFIKMAETLTV